MKTVKEIIKEIQKRYNDYKRVKINDGLIFAHVVSKQKRYCIGYYYASNGDFEIVEIN